MNDSVSIQMQNFSALTAGLGVRQEKRGVNSFRSKQVVKILR